MAPSQLLVLNHLAKWTITTYIMAHIMTAATAAPHEGAVGAGAPETGTFSVATWRKIRSPKQEYQDIPNTLSTTAHIHTLLFQPGIGVRGFDSRTDSGTPPSFSSTPQPFLRGALPSTTSIVGLTARTYQDSLSIPFSEYFQNLTLPKSTPGGGDALHEATRGTFCTVCSPPGSGKQP